MGCRKPVLFNTNSCSHTYIYTHINAQTRVAAPLSTLSRRLTGLLTLTSEKTPATDRMGEHDTIAWKGKMCSDEIVGK